MNNYPLFPTSTLLIGAKTKARYLQSSIPLYKGNPLIEALPPILSSKEAYDRLRFSSPYSSAERDLPLEERLHCLGALMQFYEPFSKTISLEQTISRLLRGSYVARNPAARTYWATTEENLNRLDVAGYSSPRYKSMASGHPFIGISGIGKSAANNAVLGLYPQVIYHSEYQGHPFSFTQMVWLKTECPGDASVRGLFFNFFQGVDAVLDTQYFRNYAKNGRATVDAMLPYVGRVASLHALGLWVIDETQNLSEAKSGGAAKMLNYFVQFENELGLPIMPIGTPKVTAIFSKNEFRQARRMTGDSYGIWEPMNNNREWQAFINVLWQYQYTQQNCPLTQELSDTLYDISQGITDIAIKVYRLAQIRAITSKQEVVTKATLRSVEHDDLQLVRDCLKALKSRDVNDLSRFCDIYSKMDWDEIFQREIQSRLKDTEGGVASSSTASLSVESASPKEVVKIQKVKKKKTQKLLPEGLGDVVQQGIAQKQSPHLVLTQAGYIRLATEFLVG